MLMIHSPHTEIHPPAVRDNPQTPQMRDFSLRRLQRRVLEALCAGVVVVTLLGPVRAEEPPAPDGMLSLPAAEIPAPTPATADPVMIDPFIELRGSVRHCVGELVSRWMET